MATGWPMKVSYANGDVYSASDVNDTNGTINLLGSSVAYTAGKNRILNSDFRIWQRGTSFTAAGYTADRWTIALGGGSGANTTSQQSFTAGTAPVAGYEGQYFLRWNQTTGASGNPTLIQKIEDVRTFAGQTVTVSFWAKVASAGTPLASIVLAQEFGSGGSGTVNATLVNSPSLTTSWTRYTYSVAVPSISGKTLGTGNNLSLVFYGNASTTYTFDIWGVQLEQGSTATAFQTSTGTIQGELAACQRYYYRVSPTSSSLLAYGSAANTTLVDFIMALPVTLRTASSTIEYASVNVQDGANTYSTATYTIPITSQYSVFIRATFGSATVTQFRPYSLQTTSGSGYMAISAEL
jgi:hypothetical protein